MSTDRIRVALESALKTWADAQTPVIPVAWANVGFEPPADRFVRATLLPAKTNNRMLAGNHRQYAGIFQVNIFTPAGAGDGAGRKLADALDAVFPVSTPKVYSGLAVYTMSPPWSGTAIDYTKWWMLPVYVEYEANEVK